MSGHYDSINILQVQRLLNASEKSRVSQGPESLDQAVRYASDAIAILKSSPEKDSLEWQVHLTRAWKLCGLAEEERRTPAGRAAAVRAYDESLKAFLPVLDPRDAAAQFELGSIWTHRGMNLLGNPTPAELHEALRCFDQAIHARSTLPLDQDWRFGWGLAASLMNKADALTRLGHTGELAEAVRCYDQALTLLASLPASAPEASVRQRQVVAWMNRGLTLQAQSSPEGNRGALASANAAIAILRTSGFVQETAFKRTLACALINQSHAHFSSEPSEALLARDSAVEAVALLAGLEEADLVAAEAGLKARQALCRALAWVAEAAPAGEVANDDWVGEITDAVDDALKLTHVWEARGETHFRPLAASLFRLGSLVFSTWQPHFLAEYLLDHLDPARSASAPVNDEDMHAAAQEALWHAAENLRRRSQTRLGSKDSDAEGEQVERDLQTLCELQEAEARLTELRQQYLPNASGSRPW